MSRIARLLPVLTSTAEIPWYLKGGVSAANCIAAYKAIGAASLAASYVNLANPGTYDITASTAPTWAADTGWTFDGASQYLLSLTPTDALTSSILIRFSGATGDTGYIAGYYPADGLGFTLTPRRSGLRKYFNGSVVLNVGTYSASGVIGIAGDQAYINGVADGTITTAAQTEQAITIGASGRAPGIHTYFAGNVQAVSIYNTVLSPAQVIAVTNAMAALPPP